MENTGTTSSTAAMLAWVLREAAPYTTLSVNSKLSTKNTNPPLIHIQISKNLLINTSGMSTNTKLKISKFPLAVSNTCSIKM
jgi:hypothetical protein